MDDKMMTGSIAKPILSRHRVNRSIQFEENAISQLWDKLPTRIFLWADVSQSTKFRLALEM
jgi:hypothetical protein